MKINYKMLVAMLQEELIYVKNDLNTTIADLETEERIKNALEGEVAQLFDANTAYIHEKAELGERFKELNTDFFVLGDLFMEEIKKNEGKLPKQKLEDVVTGMDDFLHKQYEERIDNLEALIFEMGDDLDEQKAVTKKTITEMKKEAYENGMAMEKLKKENKECMQVNSKLSEQVVLFRKQVVDFASKNENMQGDIETSAKSKEEAFEEDRKQIAEEIKKAEEPTTNKQSSTPGEHTPKSKAKSARENTITILGIKNKLCNKGYDVQDTGKSLLAKKPGNRHIEVKPAELPGSFKYIICGQTCYEFDQAIKASTYGAKAIAPKLDAEAIS